MNELTKNKLFMLLREAHDNHVNISSYKAFVVYLNENMEYNIKCHLMMHKYLYGSFVKEAMSV